MLGIFDRLSWPQRVTTAVLAAVAVFLVIVEALSVESVPGAVGILLCGLLPVATLLMPTVSAAAVSAIAVLSITFTIICTQLPVPPDNTFGIIEMLGLATLTVRVIIQFRPLPATWLTALFVVAAPLLPLRLPDEEYRPLMGAAILFGMAFVAMLGMYMRLYDRRRVDAFELARQAQRLEYARDLHDFVAHHVTAIVAQAKAVRFTTAAGLPPSPEALDDMLAGIEKAGSQALVSMRGMITVLRDDGEPVRPHQTLPDAVAAAAGTFTGPPVTTSIDESIAARDLPQETLDAAKHVVQESLTNILRHAAEVTRVKIRARDEGSSVTITVTNDGIAADNGLPSGGFGLVGLTERVESAGGRLTAGPTGGGWSVTAVLPSSTA
ncbi:sensor histidine kinase [Kibdelosporangium persicum]|uniref:histidine kinase n=1 Tax=Kibdelosporangium persicum TaxID=2698649 RepID=A0ABX2F2A0_9PSEU|nr:histidine kinase [Kibdelosporangium persicum]NRN65249.1 Two-component sensor histidine kinase [Kibdelosporangium persicum]